MLGDRRFRFDHLMQLGIVGGGEECKEWLEEAEHDRPGVRAWGRCQLFEGRTQYLYTAAGFNAGPRVDPPVPRRAPEVGRSRIVGRARSVRCGAGKGRDRVRRPWRAPRRPYRGPELMRPMSRARAGCQLAGWDFGRSKLPTRRLTEGASASFEECHARAPERDSKSLKPRSHRAAC